MRLRYRMLAVLALVAGWVPGEVRADETEAARVRAELRVVESAIEERRRLIPAAEDDFEAFVRARARAAGLPAVAVQSIAERHRVARPDGHAGPVVLHRWDVSGTAPWGDAHSFLHLVATARASRLLDVESLKVEPAAGGRVAFSARFALAEWAPEPPPAVSLPPSGDPRAAMLAVEREVLQRKRQELATLDALGGRYQPSRLVDALAAFEHEARLHAVALTGVAFDGEAQLRGVALGAAARAAVQKALTAARLQGAVRFTALGDCHAFSVAGRVGTGDIASQVVVGNGLFEKGASEACQRVQGAAVRVAASGRSAAPEAINLRLGDVDVADAFRALHDVSRRAFLVDPGVEGRLTLDFQNATLDDALAAMKDSPFAVSGGRLRRVSRRGAAPPGAQAFDGEPVTMLLRKAEVRDILCLFAQISGLEIHAPRTLQGQVSLYATDVPWDGILGTVVEATASAYRMEGTRVLVTPLAPGPTAPALEDACGGGTQSWARRLPSVDQLDGSDLRFAGVGRVGSAVKAYAHGPGGTFWVLDEGQRLFSGRVSSVAPHGMTITSPDGRATEMRLPD